jgi:protein required for attachment to host cells
MKMKTGLWIVVADGARGMVLINEGTAAHPLLKVHRAYEQDNPRTSAQGDARPDRQFESSGSRRSAMEVTDLHQRAEDRFVDRIMADLAKDAHAKAFDNVVIVAPPVALGEMRKAAHADVTHRVTAWIDKDLTKMPVPEIASAVAKILDS